MSTYSLSGEQANTKLLAVFDTEAALHDCVQLLESEGADPNQLARIAPDDPHYSSKIEPESKGIERTAIRSHLSFGIIGFIVGLALWAALYAAKITLIIETPGRSLIPFLFFGAALGGLAGGLMTLRPDHLVVIEGVKSAMREGKWSLVIHSRSAEQTKHYSQVLEQHQVHVSRSI